MRGEFIAVWSETWPYIWHPILEHEGVPGDVFCELYREVARALKRPSPAAASRLVLNDALHLREVFEHALLACEVEVDKKQRDSTFDEAIPKLVESSDRLPQLASLVTLFTKDTVTSRAAVERAVSKLATDPNKVAEAQERVLDDIVNDRTRSKDAFERITADDFAGERAVVTFLESAYDIFDDFGNDPVSNEYYNLLDSFIAKFSLRYDLRRRCMLCPTLPGVFASLVRDLRLLTAQDAHLDALMKDFENALRDLRQDTSDGRIKTAIQKQFNLLEAMGRNLPGVTGTTLGVICNEANTWPHSKLKDAMKDLYRFASDYPGIRHAGTPANKLREVDMRDMVAISILLAGFAPYLSDGLNPDTVYRGA